MRIAILGAGNVGGTLGRRWATMGHDVTFGVRRPGDGAAAVKGGGALPEGARLATPAAAVRGAEVVLLAVPWSAARAAVEEAGAGALDGMPVLDAMNPIAAGVRVDVGPDGHSGAERVQAMVPRAHVVKAFNTCGFNVMADPSFGGRGAFMPYAGDDGGAKAVAHRLATELGFEAQDAGPLVRARELEHLAALWIALALGVGTPALGREIAFRLERR